MFTNRCQPVFATIPCRSDVTVLCLPSDRRMTIAAGMPRTGNPDLEPSAAAEAMNQSSGGASRAVRKDAGAAPRSPTSEWSNYRI